MPLENFAQMTLGDETYEVMTFVQEGYDSENRPIFIVKLRKL